MTWLLGIGQKTTPSGYTTWVCAQWDHALTVANNQAHKTRERQRVHKDADGLWNVKPAWLDVTFRRTRP